MSTCGTHLVISDNITSCSCEPEQDVEKIASQPSPPHITSSLPTHTPSHPHSMSLRMRGRRTDRLRKRERRKGSSNHVLRTRLKSKSKMKLKLVLRKYSSKVRRRGSLCNLFRIPGHLPGPCSPTVDMTTGVLEGEVITNDVTCYYNIIYK